MTRSIWSGAVLGILFAATLRAEQPAVGKVQPPELTRQAEGDWLNSRPLKLADLHGRVAVVHFWTFGCINCIHNYAAYKSWHEDYAKQGVAIIGIHTPESEGERDAAEVEKQAQKNGLTYPIVLDNDGAIWRAWGNSYWPSTYLIDKQGYVRYRWDGELNWKNTRGEEVMRGKIDELLAEDGPPQRQATEVDAPLEKTGRPKVGEEAADFELQTPDGESIQLSKIVEDGPVVLLVLRGYPGYQCPLCNVQVGEFLAMAKKFAAANARLVAVYPGAADGLKKRAREFVRGKTLPENVLLVLDPDYQFTTAYGLRWDASGETAYPSTFVIDGERKVRFAKISDNHGDRASAAETLKALQASPAE